MGKFKEIINGLPQEARQEAWESANGLVDLTPEDRQELAEIGASFSSEMPDPIVEQPSPIEPSPVEPPPSPQPIASEQPLEQPEQRGLAMVDTIFEFGADVGKGVGNNLINIAEAFRAAPGLAAELVDIGREARDRRKLESRERLSLSARFSEGLGSALLGDEDGAEILKNFVAGFDEVFHKDEHKHFRNAQLPLLGAAAGNALAWLSGLGPIGIVVSTAAGGSVGGMANEYAFDDVEETSNYEKLVNIFADPITARILTPGVRTNRTPLENTVRGTSNLASDLGKGFASKVSKFTEKAYKQATKTANKLMSGAADKTPAAVRQVLKDSVAKYNLYTQIHDHLLYTMKVGKGEAVLGNYGAVPFSTTAIKEFSKADLTSQIADAATEAAVNAEVFAGTRWASDVENALAAKVGTPVSMVIQTGDASANNAMLRIAERSQPENLNLDIGIENVTAQPGSLALEIGKTIDAVSDMADSMPRPKSKILGRYDAFNELNDFQIISTVDAPARQAGAVSLRDVLDDIEKVKQESLRTVVDSNTQSNLESFFDRQITSIQDAVLGKSKGGLNHPLVDKALARQTQQINQARSAIFDFTSQGLDKMSSVIGAKVFVTPNGRFEAERVVNGKTTRSGLSREEIGAIDSELGDIRAKIVQGRDILERTEVALDPDYLQKAARVTPRGYHAMQLGWQANLNDFEPGKVGSQTTAMKKLRTQASQSKKAQALVINRMLGEKLDATMTQYFHLKNMQDIWPVSKVPSSRETGVPGASASIGKSGIVSRLSGLWSGAQEAMGLPHAPDPNTQSFDRIRALLAMEGTPNINLDGVDPMTSPNLGPKLANQAAHIGGAAIGAGVTGAGHVMNNPATRALGKMYLQAGQIPGAYPILRDTFDRGDGDDREMPIPRESSALLEEGNFTKVFSLLNGLGAKELAEEMMDAFSNQDKDKMGNVMMRVLSDPNLAPVQSLFKPGNKWDGHEPDQAGLAKEHARVSSLALSRDIDSIEALRQTTKLAKAYAEAPMPPMPMPPMGMGIG